jgi:hypothetical protein
MDKVKKVVVSQQTVDQLDSVANYFFSLPEETLRQLTTLQELISQYSANPDADPAIQSLIGNAHGFMDDVKSFVRSLGISIGKLRGALIPPTSQVQPAANPQENQQLYAKRVAQVSGEEDKEKELDPKFKKIWDSPLSPGTVYRSMEPFVPEAREDKKVGAGYDPSFLAEDIIRRARGGFALGAPYQSVQEAYDAEIGDDKNLSKETKEEVIKILSNLGYKVKGAKEADNKELY